MHSRRASASEANPLKPRAISAEDASNPLRPQPAAPSAQLAPARPLADAPVPGVTSGLSLFERAKRFATRTKHLIEDPVVEREFRTLQSATSSRGRKEALLAQARLALTLSSDSGRRLDVGEARGLVEALRALPDGEQEAATQALRRELFKGQAPRFLFTEDGAFELLHRALIGPGQTADERRDTLTGLARAYQDQHPEKDVSASGVQYLSSLLVAVPAEELPDVRNALALELATNAVRVDGPGPRPGLDAVQEVLAKLAPEVV